MEYPFTVLLNYGGDGFCPVAGFLYRDEAERYLDGRKRDFTIKNLHNIGYRITKTYPNGREEILISGGVI